MFEIKGLIERIRGYERLLEKHPHFRCKTVLFQVVTPPQFDSDANKCLKSRLDGEIARVCGRFGTPTWTPIKYMYQSVSQLELMKLYARASVGLVAPIRDGASQVGKEFIACSSSDSVLVMSSFLWGGEGSINDSAVVQVNPLEKDLMADTIKSALEMDADERRSRMANLKTTLRRFDVRSWMSGVCEAAYLATPVLSNRLDKLVKIPPAVLVSFVERQKRVNSSIDRHGQDLIAKSAIKNIV